MGQVSSKKRNGLVKSSSGSKVDDLSLKSGSKGKQVQQFAPLSIKDNANGSSVLSFLQENIDVCNSFTKLYSMKSPEKSGTSYSAQVLGTLGDKRLFIKVFSSNIIKITYNNLLVEAAIYSCVVPLLLQRHTPFLIKFLGFQECDGLFLRLKQELQYSTDVQMKTDINMLLTRLEIAEGVSDMNKDETNAKVLAKFYDPSNRAYLLALEQIDPSTTIKYQDWIQEQRTLDMYISVWFQLVWTLLCFERAGLRHNDLHWNNIYVEDLGDNPQTLYFAIKTKNRTVCFKVLVRFKLKLFDYDRSTIPGFIHNTVLKDVAPYGFGGEAPNYGYDATRITCYTKFGLLDVEEEDPTFTNTSNKFIEFLRNFEKVRGKEIPLEYNQFCNRPTKAEFVKQKKDAELAFVDQEIIYDFDYPSILINDPFFATVRIESIPSDQKAFVLPDQKTNEEIRSLIATRFPEILYHPPIAIKVES